MQVCFGYLRRKMYYDLELTHGGVGSAALAAVALRAARMESIVSFILVEEFQLEELLLRGSWFVDVNS